MPLTAKNSIHSIVDTELAVITVVWTTRKNPLSVRGLLGGVWASLWSTREAHVCCFLLGSENCSAIAPGSENSTDQCFRAAGEDFYLTYPSIDFKHSVL
jgi:hypothetical protein